MKNQVEVNGQIFKVGDVIENKGWDDREILFIGDVKYFFKDLDEGRYEGSSPIDVLVYWKPKRATKTIEVDYWVNVYNTRCNIHISKEEADKYKHSSITRLDCINIKKSYEVYIDSGEVVN